MSLTPPAPISPNYVANVEALIQVLLQNMKGVGNSIQAQRNKQRIFEPTLFEILEKVKNIGMGNIQSDWLETNPLDGSFILNKPTLSNVATSGDYNDLLNLPVLFDGTWASLLGKPTFATVATSGSYNDLINLPTLFTTSDARTSISLTTTGTSGAATYNSSTGVLNVPQYASGISTMGNIGNEPNAQGATISGTTLTLQPANASFGGVVTTGAQTFLGQKSFINALVASGGVQRNGMLTFTMSNSTGVSGSNESFFRFTSSNILRDLGGVGGGGNNTYVQFGTGQTVNFLNAALPVDIIGVDYNINVQNISGGRHYGMLIRTGDVGIGTATPSASARLEINSTTQGFLPPRMTETQRNAISSPATGLSLYCTDCVANDASVGVMQTYNGTSWKNYW